MPTTNDLIGLAIDKNPVEFADTFNQLIMQKAHDRISQHKVDIAQSIYGDDEDIDGDLEEDDTDDTDDGSDDEFELDLDDIDLEDLEDLEDLDLADFADLDLNDIDLEDLTDGSEDA